jgi:hypothetical protein
MSLCVFPHLPFPPFPPPGAKVEPPELKASDVGKVERAPAKKIEPADTHREPIRDTSLNDKPAKVEKEERQIRTAPETRQKPDHVVEQEVPW